MVCPSRTSRSGSRGVPMPTSTSGQTGTHSTVLAEFVDQERIPFVSTVEADLLPEEARGDPHTDRAQRIPRPAAVSMISTSPSGATSPDRIVVRDGRFEELKNASYSRSTSGRYFKSVT